MRLISLRLTNYRGIDDSEVLFSPHGITIVEGPNEAGKTSLIEAIRLLFDYFDSSTRGAIKDIKPATRDVGTEIRLEAESGPYIFTYKKRFNKRPETTLTVKSSKLENHAGREAHERALEILHETIDVNLWRALSVQQGEAVEQADLSKQTSLSAALDIVAGGQRADPQEESLFDKVRTEYGRFFTERGGEKKELQDARKVQKDTEEQVASLKTKIQDLEKDTVRAAELGQELERLKNQEKDLQEDVSGYTSSLDEIMGLETALGTACITLESAQKSEQVASRDKRLRQDLIKNVSKASEAHRKLDESSTSSTPLVNQAKSDLKNAQSDADKTETRHKQAESLLKLRYADKEYFNDKLHLEQLKERKGRIDRARKETALADQLLASNSVDEVALRKIQTAERSLITARARLEMGAPAVLLRGLASFEFQIDDEPTNISKDEEINLSVSNGVRVTIPESLQLEVTPGSSSTDLSEKVEVAKQKLDTVCSDAGVSNAKEARQSYDERQEAQRSIERQKDIETNDLRDLTYEELDRKFMGLGTSVPAYPAERNSETTLPENLKTAKQELRSATGDLKKAAMEWEEARSELDTVRNVLNEVRSQYQKVKVKLDLKAEELKIANGKLARDRAIIADHDLELAHSKSLKLVHAEEEKVESAKTDLRDREPDRIKALAETSQGSLETVQETLEEVQKRNIEVRTRLKVFGEEGLHEKLNAAQSHLNHVSQEKAAMMRRAQAAMLLYETMKEEREKARRAYVVPLKEKIERLGRLVFNNSFEVDLSQDLSVASRTMDGASIVFRSLSGGTKEQISLISRLACSMTVSKDGGAPLILDDALGYTDPERLKLMGAVLAKAGKTCQIIILTCVPDRYSNVGKAKVVRLG